MTDDAALSKDVARILTFVRAYPGITGRELVLETGLERERALMVVLLMEQNEVVSIKRPPAFDFETSRLYPRV